MFTTSEDCLRYSSPYWLSAELCFDNGLVLFGLVLVLLGYVWFGQQRLCERPFCERCILQKKWNYGFVNLFPFEEGEPALKPSDHGLTCFHAGFPLTISLLAFVVVVLKCHHQQLLLLPLTSCSFRRPFYLVEGTVSIIPFSLPFSYKIDF